MFKCIACKKPADDGDEKVYRGISTPRSKDAVKSLTSQIKDMALKFPGAYKQCTSSSSSFKRGNHYSYPNYDSDTASHTYRGGGSSTIPTWRSTNYGHRQGIRVRSPNIGASSRGSTPRRMESMPSQAYNIRVERENHLKEWTAQVEPGVHITFVTLSNGGNELKRIRFNRDMFDKWQAQSWWGENYDRIMELYNVQSFNRQPLRTPPRSEDERESTKESPIAASPMQRNYNGHGNRIYFPSYPNDDICSSGYGVGGSTDVPRTTTSSRDEPSVSASNASELETEWVEEDEPGVYITIRQLADGTRELRRVRFSRERFEEENAKLWWEENKERIQVQYL